MAGFIFYRGASLIDNAPIIGIATLESANAKTGDMVQTWILREDVSPLDAIQSGADASICGACMHRGAPGRARTCYVDVGKAPQGVWLAYHRGVYADLSSDPQTQAYLTRNRVVRLGAYGDPGAIGRHYWTPMLADALGYTGYSHQWREAWASHMRDIVMASADSALDRDVAQSMGWRTFRVRTESDPLAAREIACPASPEGGDRRQCINCKACDGASRGTRQASVAIIVHGTAAKHFASIAA